MLVSVHDLFRQRFTLTFHTYSIIHKILSIVYMLLEVGSFDQEVKTMYEGWDSRIVSILVSCKIECCKLKSNKVSHTAVPITFKIRKLVGLTVKSQKYNNDTCCVA